MNLGKYRLLAELARGGMGVVYLAEARGPGGFEKLVVVKELKRDLADDPVYCAMFLDEARLAARLSHRHIVQTNEVACEDGRYFMVLELLEGGSLHQIRKKLGLGALPRTLAVRVIAAVLDALHHAHELTDGEGRSLGVVHRDVSPQNVFLTFDGDVKLIDFGVAKSADRRGSPVTQVGVVKGSVPYMSPDHVDGKSIDRRADVFAVGVLLREMLGGERLWGDSDDLTILRRLIARDLPAIPRIAGASIHSSLLAIIARAMAPKRDDRYPTAAAMRDALESYLAEVDPRGSLAALGPWLATALATEHAAFRAVVRESRTKNANAQTAQAATTKSEVWLPSCELSTRYSGPPLLPLAPPPLPTRASPASHGRFVRAGAVALAACLALAGLGFSGALPIVTDHATQANANATVAQAIGQTPRTVEGAITVSVDTTAVTEAKPADAIEGNDAKEITAAISAPMSEESAAASVPTAVLHEALPPNPYDDAK